MLNRVVLIGRLASDPELRYTPSGVAVANFRLAVSRRVANAQGENEADFFSVVAWRQAAEFAANYLTKGRLVAIDGRLQSRSWVAQDGTRRNVVEIVADIVRALERPKETATSEIEEPVGDVSPEVAEAGAEEEVIGLDDDPFAEDG